MRESQLFQNCFDFYWKYHNFERNEIRATGFLKWTDFKIYAWWLMPNITSFCTYAPWCGLKRWKNKKGPIFGPSYFLMALIHKKMHHACKNSIIDCPHCIQKIVENGSTLKNLDRKNETNITLISFSEAVPSNLIFYFFSVFILSFIHIFIFESQFSQSILFYTLLN